MDAHKKKNWFKQHKVWTVVIVLVIIGIIGASTDGNSTNTTASTSSSKNSNQTASNKSQLAKIGQPAKDGKFEFTVNKISCGETSLSDGFGNVEATAQGQFCRMNVSVKNIGNQAQSFDETAQYLYDTSGKKYSIDTTATIWAQPTEQSPWGNDINPGNTLTGDVMYDVPKAVTPVTAELHDSSFSGGVKVSLQ